MNNKRHKSLRHLPVQGRHALRLAVLVAAMSIGAGSPPAVAGKADSSLLERLAGSWKGRGKLKPTPTAKSETVSCRMEGTWNAGSKSLSLDMSCKGVDVSFSSSGFLRVLQGRNAVEGRWNGGGGIGKTAVVGRWSGNSLSLTLTSSDIKSGTAVRSSVSLRLAGGGRKLSNSVTSRDRETGRNYQVLSLSMRK